MCLMELARRRLCDSSAVCATLQDTRPPLQTKIIGVFCISGGAYVCHMPSLRAQSGCQERGLNLRLEMGAVRSQGADAWHREIGFGKDRSNEARGRKATAKSSLRIWCPPPYPLNIIQFGCAAHTNGDTRRRKEGAVDGKRERKEKQRGEYNKRNSVWCGAARERVT